ncbi:anhydro-N-acetylmuramic acid kinase [Streptomyces sp. NPDC003077]|uniref:anhydro-N-acetylmuramic acid kinase n=1 Tax=Streptomyces sp. NPDC003077 TaxID=3154443 RepID=UPI0033ADEF9F
MRILALMSGTSHDAIDAAAADLARDGDTLRLTPLGTVSAAYSPGLRADLISALPPAPTTMEQVCRLDTRIGQEFAALAVRADRELCDGRADLVVSHGQTVYHWTDDGRALGTLQLGRSAWIAEATGHPVLSDLRPRDIAAGGQGAPLVSLFDVLWLRGRPGRPAAVNLGGIANITVPAPDGPPLAYDTGPANALLDAATHHFTHGALPYDTNGALAARGTVHRPLLHHLLADPYYARPAPKTTGKEHFHLPYLLSALAALPTRTHPSPEDILATLAHLTARTVADAAHSAAVTEVIASGGGTHNPTLLSALRTALAPVPLLTSDTLGLPTTAKEPYAFTVLAWLTLHSLPSTLPSCTGARHPSLLGTLTPGREGWRLPERVGKGPERVEFEGGP